MVLCTWADSCLISITPQASGSGTSTDYEFASRTRDVDIGTGAKDIEGMPTNSGGRCYTKKPEEDSEWEFSDCFFTGVQTSTGIAQFFERDSISGLTASALEIFNSRNRMKCRVAILWTEDTTATTGAGATVATKQSYRIICADAYVTEFTESWEDGLLKATFKVKFAPFDLSGNPNRLRQEAGSGAGYTGLTALGNYNETQKGATSGTLPNPWV
jgi:hypothetical protein